MDQITDIPEVDATREQFIAAIVQRELAAAAKVAALVTDVSEFAEPGRKSIDFPKLGSFAVQKVGTGDTVDAQTLTATVDTLNLDQNAAVHWILKKQASLQSKLRMEEAFAARAASAHSRGVEKDVLDAMVTGAAAANAVTYNAGAIEGNILSVVQKLDEANAPEEDRFLVFRPAQKNLLLQVQNLVQTNRYSSNVPIMRGEIGMAYGLRFVMSNILGDSYVDGVMIGFHKEALALGFQMAAEFGEEPAMKHGVGSKRQGIDMLYGYKVTLGGALISVVS